MKKVKKQSEVFKRYQAEIAEIRARLEESQAMIDRIKNRGNVVSDNNGMHYDVAACLTELYSKHRLVDKRIDSHHVYGIADDFIAIKRDIFKLKIVVTLTVVAASASFLGMILMRG